jgi:glutamine amidotransferase
MIVIIDYGMGNLRSVQKGFERMGFTARITRDLGEITSARGVVLPGVGAFQACMDNLRRFELIDPIREIVKQQKPFLGICLGFQLLFSESEEFGKQKGLDLFPGQVVGFATRDGLKVPHMGWNTLNEVRPHPVFAGLPLGPDGLHGYFVHSFHLVPADPADLIATADYGGPVTAAVGRANMIGTQFHPEKSQQLGLGLIANFLRWAP